MDKIYHTLVKERIASIREVQKNPSKALRGVTRVMRGSHTVGFFFDNEELDNLLEDIEASASPHFQAHMRRARREMKAGKFISLEEVLKRYGV